MADTSVYFALRSALDKIEAGQVNQGAEEWEAVFQERRHEVGLAEALFLKEQYADVLFRLNLESDAHLIDTTILAELEEDESSEQPLISQDDQARLADLILLRYGQETIGSGHDDNTARPWGLPRHRRAQEAAQQHRYYGPPLSVPRQGLVSFNAPPLVGFERPMPPGYGLSARFDRLDNGPHCPGSRPEPTRAPIRRTTTEPTLPRSSKQTQPAQTTGDSRVASASASEPALSRAAATQGETLQSRDMSTPEGQALDWYDRLNEVHNFIYGFDNAAYRFIDVGSGDRTYPKVKVAVLDRGLAFLQHRRALSMVWEATGQDRCRSFIHGEAPDAALQDESGHGTAVAYQVVKTCPTAEVFVFRVVGQDGTINIDAVADALHECCRLRVDVVNMSFGWASLLRELQPVEAALRAASAQRILLFASTSNYGPNEGYRYPAKADEVIAVDAADGLGVPAPFNPWPDAPLDKNQVRIAAPGIGNPSPIYAGPQPLAGTSFASPIAAGVAALVLEFARQPPINDDASVMDSLTQRRGMCHVLLSMAAQRGNGPYFFLMPWRLFQDDGGLHGGDGGPTSKRYFVARAIVNVLRQCFGPHVGSGIFPG